MNRYVLAGILRDLAAGRSVLVVSPSLEVSRHAHDQLLEYMHAPVLTDDVGTGYTWAPATGGQWVRDDHTKAVATFVSARSAMLDHAGGDVVVINGWRDMRDEDDTRARVAAATNRRDTVEID